MALFDQFRLFSTSSNSEPMFVLRGRQVPEMLERLAVAVDQMALFDQFMIGVVVVGGQVPEMLERLAAGAVAGASGRPAFPGDRRRHALFSYALAMAASGLRVSLSLSLSHLSLSLFPLSLSLFPLFLAPPSLLLFPSLLSFSLPPSSAAARACSRVHFRRRNPPPLAPPRPPPSHARSTTEYQAALNPPPLPSTQADQQLALQRPRPHLAPRRRGPSPMSRPGRAV